MAATAIRVDGIRFTYGDVVAVDDVSFDVAEGEILGFLGPNGAGKSTTIKVLTGLLDPQAGRVTVLGQEMPRDKEAIQRRMGVCFEEKNLYTDMTGRENLIFFSRLFGLRGFDPDDLLRRVGLFDRRNDRVSGYSKGMRQRLMVARSLVNGPDVLFLDEPTDGLDPVSAQAIRRIIQEEAARGAAVVLTTHNMMEADHLSNRVAFINEGRVLTIDTPENLKLAHGERAVRVRIRTGGEVAETVIPLDDGDAGDRVRAAMSTGDLVTVHTEEATLEDVFIEFAGRGLE
jgi:ABC-type multidrug transport system ATPase subunit